MIRDRIRQGTKSMPGLPTRILVIFIVGILVGGIVSYISGYLIYTPRFNKLKTELSDMESQYEVLSGEYGTLFVEHEALSGEYKDLEADRDNLQSQYSKLSLEYDALESDHILLLNDYEKASDYLKDLSGDVKGFIYILDYYYNITEAFHHVLNKEEVEKVSSNVLSITKESEDNWYAYERIYIYVSNKIDYIPDIEFPYIVNYDHEIVDDEVIITSFTVDTIMNYIQTPEFTLEYKYGDCEDQVILVYAMIKYYEKNIYGAEYTTYIADIEFSDGSSHLSVFLPGIGGRTRSSRLCILDPAKHYFTNKDGHITQKLPSTELKGYSDILSKNVGEITYIKLYDVDLYDGSYIVAESGTLEEIIEFLSTE